MSGTEEKEVSSTFEQFALLNVPYDEAFGALDTNGPFTVLDLRDDDASSSWRLRVPELSPADSSAENTPSTRQSDISENDNLPVYFGVKNFPWSDALNKEIFPLDVQLSDDLLNLGVKLAPKDEDEMKMFLEDPFGMGRVPTDTKIDGFGTLDSSILRTSSPPRSGDQGHPHGDNEKNGVKSTWDIWGRQIAPEYTPPSKFETSMKNHTVTGHMAPEHLKQIDRNVDSSSKWYEPQLRNRCSTPFKAHDASLEDTEGSEMDGKRSQIMDTPLKSVEFPSQNATPDSFSNKSNLQFAEAQRDGSINTSECKDNLYNIYKVETEEDTLSLRSGSSKTEEIELEEPALDADWVLNYALIKAKELFLQELVNYAEFEPIDGLDSSGSRKRARESSSSNSSSPASHLTGQPPQKRLRGAGGDQGDDEESSDDKDDNNKRPSGNGKPVPLGFPVRRLKCPFNQRQPEKYTRAACRGGGFADMAKLKDHIKRVHSQPLRCLRCWEEMESDDKYAAHLQALAICNRQKQPVDDRLPYQMLKNLDFKKAPYAKAKNTEQKWKILYSVLFPDDTEIPSPYDQHNLTPRLQQILYDALEEELIAKMAPAVEPIIQQIKQSIPAIIQNCKLRLLQANSDSETPCTPGSVAGFYSTDSEQHGQQHQLASPPDSESASSMSLPHVAKGRQLLHNGPPPAISSPDDFPESWHMPVPGNTLDRHTATPSHTYNIHANESSGPSNYLPEDTSTSSQIPRFEVPGNLPPLLGGLSESQFDAFSPIGSFGGPDPPPTANSMLPQQNGLADFNGDYGSANFDPLQVPQPYNSHTVLSPLLPSSSSTGPNDRNVYAELDALPSNSDPFHDILEFDQPHS